MRVARTSAYRSFVLTQFIVTWLSSQCLVSSEARELIAHLTHWAHHHRWSRGVNHNPSIALQRQLTIWDEYPAGRCSQSSCLDLSYQEWYLTQRCPMIVISEIIDIYPRAFLHQYWTGNIVSSNSKNFVCCLLSKFWRHSVSVWWDPSKANTVPHQNLWFDRLRRSATWAVMDGGESF